jgi:hypothetical protein
VERKVKEQGNADEKKQEVPEGIAADQYPAESEDEVDVALRVGKKEEGKQNRPGEEGLGRKGARVIAEAADQPEKKRRQEKVEKGEQAQGKGLVRVEHVGDRGELGSTEEPQRKD